jgi:hypothetical protein
MKFAEIANRVTGIGCPVFGLSWSPPPLERGVALRVIAFLEDRRVLYTPYELEMPDRCIESVLQIREYLTSEIKNLSQERPLTQNLRAMRYACRLQKVSHGY